MFVACAGVILRTIIFDIMLSADGSYLLTVGETMAIVIVINNEHAVVYGIDNFHNQYPFLNNAVTPAIPNMLRTASVRISLLTITSIMSAIRNKPPFILV